MDIALEKGQTQTRTREILVKYKISYPELIRRCNLLGISPQVGEGIEYMTAEQVEMLDDVDRHIKETGGIEGYAGEGALSISTSTEVEKGELVISEASDMEQVTHNPTTNAAHTNPVHSAQIIDRVKDNPNSGFNAARVRDAGELYAEEEVMARAYANRLVENPEEMPTQMLKEIEVFMDHLDKVMPKPKRKTAEDIANELFKDWGLK